MYNIQIDELNKCECRSVVCVASIISLQYLRKYSRIQATTICYREPLVKVHEIFISSR